MLISLSRKSPFRLSQAALLCASLATGPVWAQTATSPNQSAADQIAIARVLENYRLAVTTGDEALFSTTLLDDQIPFFAVSDAALPASTDSQALRGVAGFRQSVFRSGRRYTQRFDAIQIVQHPGLAQAMLHFVTERSDGSGASGWKTLTLVNVAGQWKIASEFYTVAALPAAQAVSR